MELVYLWVENYKNIHKQGFNFSPKFNCHYDGDTLTIKDNVDEDGNKQYIENFFGDNINVTAIVGKNGSGKSNILNLLKEYTLDRLILIVLDKNELVIYNLLSQKNINPINLSSYGIKPFLITKLFQDNSEVFDYSYKKKFLNPFQYIYVKTYLDFNNIDKNELGFDGRNTVFDRIKRFDYLQKVFESKKELVNTIAIRDKLGLKSTDIDVNMIIQNIKFDFHRNFSKYFIELSSFFKLFFHDFNFSIYIRTIEEIYQYSPYKDKIYQSTFCNKIYREYSEKIYVEEKLFFTEEKEQDYQELIIYLALLNLYVRNQDAEYYIDKNNNLSFKELFLVILKEKSFSEHIKEEIDTWEKLYKLFSEKNIKKINSNNLFKLNLKLYNLIKHDIFNISFTPTLSTGEERLAYILIELYDFFNIKQNQKNTVIAVDEGESFLHPQWQKQFILIITEFIKNFFPNIKVTFLLTTHSPFLISDIPKQNIIFLDKYKEDDNEVKSKTQKEGNCKVVDGLTQTFGANIHTLLTDSFFMEGGLMGEFAKQKINKIIKNLKDEESTYTEKEKTNVLLTIESIGEPFLKSKLLDMYNRRFIDDYKIREKKRIDEQIRILKEKREQLDD